MTVVVQLRADVARLMHRGAGLEGQTADLVKVRQNLIEELERLHLSLQPMHPDAEDLELARYFTLSSATRPVDEETLGSLCKLEAVTAAYIKPEAEPA